MMVLDNACPRCSAELKNALLYKCVRCFSVYCKECTDSNSGNACPQCRMSQRMLLKPDSRATRRL
jgi:DNA-directed RNA polymerase subunit RPC12/RpoP